MSFFSLFFTNPVAAIIFLLVVVVAITVHEFSHAFVADYFGDPTPRSQGRISLSPLAHLDLLGSIAFLIFGFGWGKPVLYDPSYFRHRGQELLVALAGPASNILLALLMHLLLLGLTGQAAVSVLQTMIKINILLAAFNLIPLPPLDGSAIVAYFWPDYRSPYYAQMGSIALLAILLLIPGLLGVIIMPIENFLESLTSLFGLLP